MLTRIDRCELLALFFVAGGPVISITTRGTAGARDRGSCQSRTLSTGRSHAGTTTKSRTVYLNDGT